MEYEIFRHSVAGWFLIVTFLLFAYPHLDLKSYPPAAWIVTGIISLLLSPVLGYSAGQVVRAWHVITRRRPNDHLVDIKFLHAGIHQLLQPEQLPSHGLGPLAELSPKDLHRFVWIAYANKELRSRSESYWERYYANLGIIFTSTCGAISASILVLPLADWYSYQAAAKWLLLLVFFGLLAVNNRHYLSIAIGIENSWIKLFVKDIQKNHECYLSELFTR
jgi:hypothetical protein